MNIKTTSISHMYGLLITLFLIITPWDRIWAEYIWFAIALTAIVQLISHKLSNSEHQKLPADIIKLNYLFLLIPLISVLSFVFSPLQNLSTELLEPDVRWLLVIPVVIAIFRSKVHPNWVLTALYFYCASAFSSGLVETNFLSNLYIRVAADENANPFGMFNAMITIMLMGYTASYLKSRQYLKSATLLIFIIFGIISTLLTGTRTAFITLILGALILLYIKIESKKSLLSIIAALLILISGFIIGNNINHGNTMKRIMSMPKNAISFFTEHKTNSSTGQRLEQWRGSVCVFKKYPILGTGPRSAREAFKTYGGETDCNLKLSVHPGPRQTHSIYFNTLLTLGIAGILVFTCFFTQLLKTARKHLKSSSETHQIGATMLFMFVLGILINGIGLDMWFRNYMVNKNLIALLLPVILLFQIKESNTNNSKSIT